MIAIPIGAEMLTFACQIVKISKIFNLPQKKLPLDL
jgi:hypothetical protein